MYFLRVSSLSRGFSLSSESLDYIETFTKLIGWLVVSQVSKKLSKSWKDCFHGFHGSASPLYYILYFASMYKLLYARGRKQYPGISESDVFMI